MRIILIKRVMRRHMMIVLCILLVICISLWPKSSQELQIMTQEPYVQNIPVESAYATLSQLQTPIQYIRQQRREPLQVPQHQTQQSVNDTNNSTGAAGTTLHYNNIPNDDYTNLIDLKNFEFSINHRLCDDGTPLVVILIHSAPMNFDKRKTIRETWGYIDERSRLLFFLGSVEDDTLQNDIVLENQKYNDIVQANFIDSYRNMTYKHVTVLKWLTYYCPNAKYVFKTDDDIFANTPNIYSQLDRGTLAKNNLIYCKIADNSEVQRSNSSTWYVRPSEYRAKYYPEYCLGFAIIYSTDAALKLYREAQKLPYFWIDDVHLTGTVAKNINLTITPDVFLQEHDPYKLLDGKITKTELETFFFDYPNAEIRKLWNLVVKANQR